MMMVMTMQIAEMNKVSAASCHGPVNVSLRPALYTFSRMYVYIYIYIYRSRRVCRSVMKTQSGCVHNRPADDFIHAMFERV